MQRYLMMTNAKGAADETGSSVTVYRQGETYVLPRAVAAHFEAAGYCKAVKADADPAPADEPKPEATAAPGPSETKPAKPSKRK